jgi:hypothetical protein
MRALWAIENTYSVYKCGNKVGEITFVKYANDGEWLIKNIYGQIPISKVHFSARRAQEILEQRGFEYTAGENLPRYRLG